MSALIHSLATHSLPRESVESTKDEAGRESLFAPPTISGVVIIITVTGVMFTVTRGGVFDGNRMTMHSTRVNKFDIPRRRHFST